jgi:DNA-binding PadR family transcriptional regulator
MPVEIAIISAALESPGDAEFYGYAVARKIQANESALTLTSHGTLYKALDRLVKAGLLISRWEDPEISAAEERPRRRLYRVTAQGESVLREALHVPTPEVPGLREGLQPS